MKLKITQEVARPKGHWQVKKWNLLKGESEDTAEVINKDNLITDYFITKMITISGGTPRFKFLQFSNEIPTVELTDISAIADKSGSEQNNPSYYFPTGASGLWVGKEVKGVFSADISTSGPISMWLRLDEPLLIEEGDVLKVSYTLEPPNLLPAIASGTIPYKTYAFGEDPADPDAGTLVDNIDFTASYSFTGSNVTMTDPQYAPVKNPDGSMSYGTDLKFKFKSAVTPINVTAGAIANINCSLSVGGSNTRNLSIAFPNTKPMQTPGSYYEVEVDFNVKVLPHV